MKKVISLFLFGVILNVFALGQYNVSLLNGKSIKASSVEEQKEVVQLTVDSEVKSVKKSDVLIVVPESGKSYTFLNKNNKKIKIPKKDIKEDYEGGDVARIFAYKYLKGDSEVKQLYSLYSGDQLTEEEFALEFNKQQKKIRKRMITVWSLAGFGFIIGVTALISSLNTASAISTF